MKRAIILAISALILISCSTTQKVYYSQNVLDTYLGITHQELVEDLGAPTEQVSDGSDGYILVYEGNRRLFSYSSKYANKSATLPKAEFYMNADGIVQKVRADNTNSIKVTSVGGTIALVLLILILL